MNFLKQCRSRIDAVDKKLVALLARRQALMPGLGRCKRQNGLPIAHPKREKEVLARLLALSKKLKLSPVLVRKIFVEIFKDSKRLQRK